MDPPTIERISQDSKGIGKPSRWRKPPQGLTDAEYPTNGPKMVGAKSSMSIFQWTMYWKPFKASYASKYSKPYRVRFGPYRVRFEKSGETTLYFGYIEPKLDGI